MQSINFKEKFLEHYEKLTDIKEFTKYSSKYPRKSLRVNTIKTSIPKIKKRLENYKLTQIPWCKEGFYLEGRTDLGNLEEHNLGYIYIQSSVSMIPPLILKSKETDLVLDIAAAPGSKTTQLASIMHNKGLIIANDVSYKRLRALAMNIQRLGITNTIITQTKGQYLKVEADKILLDAPCSGTGIIRKSPKTPLQWSQGLVKQMSSIQKGLIKIAFDNLKPKGTLVYSTCSLEPEEDEAVVSYLLEKRENAKLEKIKLPIKSSPCFTSFNKKTYSPEVKKCLRIWPQDNDTDGFFVAKIKRL
tara:strand:- start:22384 stop:23289 length:906 start_codon:yes stop_codon:yes gene_type:complete